MKMALFLLPLLNPYLALRGLIKTDPKEMSVQ